MKEMKFRHEWKHEISASDRIAIRQRLGAVASLDPHATGGTYFIRSLYFDNLYDTALKEKIDGVNMREKFRIRYYDHNTSLIHLEKKSKINGLCNKISCTITADEAQKIVDGDTEWMRESSKALVIELYSKMKSKGLRPATIVDYTREPFIYAPGNVRVTLDYDIRTGMKCVDFLKPDCITVPTMSPIILEVKWDEYLPDIIKYAVQLPNIRSHAFSKYAVCRMYG